MADAKLMDTIRSGAVAWIDEHEITGEAAEQLFMYIEAALDYVEQEESQPVVTCGEPVPFRDPEGQYECVLADGHEDTHKTRLFNADRNKWITYRWRTVE